MSKNAAAASKSVAPASPRKKFTAKNLHVVRHTEGWVIRDEGSIRASSVHDTQREAIATARALARRAASTLVIHGSDGRVTARYSFSRDPFPPPEPRKVLHPTILPRSASKEAIKKAVSEAISEADNKAMSKTKRGNQAAQSNRRQRKSKAVSKRNSQREQVKD